MKHFYVYCVHEILPDGTEIPVYIGKGHDDTESGYSRMAHYLEPGMPRATHVVRIALAGKKWSVKKLADADDEIHAYALERKFVAEFGRRNLVNCTNGGCSGWTLSAESRRKMSLSRTGKKLGPVSDEHRARLVEAARRRAADPVWRAAHSARLTGRTLTTAQIAAVKAALTGKPNANRATKKVQREALIAKQRAVLLPFEGSGLPITTIFEKVKKELGLSHISALYRAAARTGVSLRTLADLSALSEEEKRLRRLEVYKRSYEKHKDVRRKKALYRAAKQRRKNKSSDLLDRTHLRPTICHQRTIREQTAAEDIAKYTPVFGELSALRADTFDLTCEAFNEEHRAFIRRYEWLGSAGVGIKWCFVARLRGELGGVVLLSEPYHPAPREALIARGACAAWTPKNLGSRLVMYACRWMTRNTDKRSFIAYADEEAGEVGQIYQACNFKFLGWKSAVYGVKPNGKRVSLQTFKRTSRMVPWLAAQGVVLPETCFTPKGFLRWSAIPDAIKKKMRQQVAQEQAALPKVGIRRGKYMLLLGAGPAETRRLNKEFTGKVEAYPKRTPIVSDPVFTL